MFKYLFMFIVCVAAQKIYGKTLFDYNINPQYDLIAEESTSYSNFWPSSEFHVYPVGRHKHHARRGHNNKGNEKRGRGPPSVHSPYHYFESSEEINDREELHGYINSHHPHGLPPGQAKKQNNLHGHLHEPPRRFPPPPVYDKNFINPWFIPDPTPLPFTVQPPPLTTPGVYVVPKLTTKRTTTTTPAPATPLTGSDDDLIYDIDVRFGRD